MKRLGTIKALALALAALLALSGAGCLAELNLSGVRSAGNRPLALRTGPGTAYEELDMLPASTPIVAIELEEGDGATWVLLEFMWQGSRTRGYTGLMRVDLPAPLPEADHSRLTRTLLIQGEVSSAPDPRAAVRAVLPAGASVTFLGFEGSYCFVEYAVNGARSRGYVREECFMVDLGEFAEDFPENGGDTFYAIAESSPMYARPDENSALICSVPFDGGVTVLYDEFDDAPQGWISIYYGGLHGYGRYDDFSDLRFPDPQTARAVLG